MRLKQMVAAAALLTGAVHSDAKAAYFDVSSWYEAASGYLQSNYVLAQMPSQQAIGEDDYGTFTYDTRNGSVLVGLDAFPYNDPTAIRRRTVDLMAEGAPGQLNGRFDCASLNANNCLGAYRYTYVLPFEIVGLAGNLSLGQLDAWDIPFFEFPDTYLSDGSSSRAGYEGFWGTVFEPTNVLTITWLPGLASLDQSAFFNLTNLSVLTNQVVAVPEPAGLGLFGAALALLGFVKRRKQADARL